jgi:ABC-type molybdate transport system substrate-binding protein
VWSERPELTLFAGAVNRAALEPVVAEFAQREGVTVNAVYNGCGVLTATMRGIQAGQTGVFPDVYMPCDRYYLEAVGELFDAGTDVVDTDIVLVTATGNPKAIRSLPDLLKPGVRVVLGEPDKCTIGVLAKRLLQSENLYESLVSSGNLVNQTTSSALLVPQVLTGAADVVLAYRTDTRAESNRLDVVSLDSPLAKAIQPISLARSTDQPQLGLRLIECIARSRNAFEQRGFNWRLDSDEPLHETHRPRRANDGT